MSEHYFQGMLETTKSRIARENMYVYHKVIVAHQRRRLREAIKDIIKERRDRG